MAPAPERGRDEVAAYLALAQIPGIGASRLRALIAAFGSARGAIQAPHGAIAALHGFSKAAATAIRGAGAGRGAEVLDQLAKLGAVVLLPEDAAFPPPLREIPEAPAHLYAWGDVALLARPAVAMVGSRNHTSYGAEAARILAACVAPAAVVVSGMARGTDAIAHASALHAARPALCAGDVVEDLGLGGLTPGPCAGAPGARIPPAELSPLQRTLWDALAAAACHSDALAGSAKAATADVLTALTELELRGVVRQDPGMRFALN